MTFKYISINLLIASFDVKIVGKIHSVEIREEKTKLFAKIC